MITPSREDFFRRPVTIHSSSQLARPFGHHGMWLVRSDRKALATSTPDCTRAIWWAFMRST